MKFTKKLKKAIGIFMATATAFAFTGCANANQAEQPNVKAEQGEQTDKAEKEKRRVVIAQHIEHPSLNLINETIVKRLVEYDPDIEITQKNANGDMSLLPSLMQNVAADGADIIVPIATQAAQAAVNATETIPIVFSAVSIPVEAGIVESFDKTDKNVTGVSNAIPIEDIFAFAKELMPEVKTYGFIYNSGEINSTVGVERAKAYCDENGIAYKEAAISSTADLAQAVSSLSDEVDAYFTPNDNMIASAMPTYIEAAGQAQKPVYVGADSMVKDGGLATVGIDYEILGNQTADMIIRILEGESISDNPVEQVKEYAKMINQKTADALGIEISEDVKKEFVIFGE